MYIILQLKKHRLHVVDSVDFFSLSTVCIYIQVFSYEVVKTCTFQSLKQHFIEHSTTWKFAKIKLLVLKNTQVVVKFDSHKIMNEYNNMEK